MQHQVAGHLEAGVADEEDARAKREGGIAKAGVGLQEGPRVTDVGPVDESQYIHQDQEGRSRRRLVAIAEDSSLAWSFMALMEGFLLVVVRRGGGMAACVGPTVARPLPRG